jgi:hypothetical protein
MSSMLREPRSQSEDGVHDWGCSILADPARLDPAKAAQIAASERRGPVVARPRLIGTSRAGAGGLAVDFVVESDRAQLGEIVRRVRDGRLRTNIGNVATLDDAVAALNPTERRKGKTIIHVRP